MNNAGQNSTVATPAAKASLSAFLSCAAAACAARLAALCASVASCRQDSPDYIVGDTKLAAIWSDLFAQPAVATGSAAITAILIRLIFMWNLPSITRPGV